VGSGVASALEEVCGELLGSGVAMGVSGNAARASMTVTYKKRPNSTSMTTSKAKIA